MTSIDQLISNSPILITGGSSGIGLALAREFAVRGGSLHLVARREEVLSKAIDSLSEDLGNTGKRPVAHICDVTKSSDVDHLFQELEKTGVRTGILVNAAGMSVPGTVVDAPMADFEMMMDTNFLGTVRVVRSVVPGMISAGQGYILNVGSLGSLVSCYGMSGYCAAKFAVRGFTESLRAELKWHGIGVSLLCPPDTDTPMLQAERPLRVPETEALNRAAPMISAEQVAKEAFRGMQKGKAHIIPSGTARITALGQRLAPGIIEALSDRIVKKARSQSR